jgi:hypothetical protein
VEKKPSTDSTPAPRPQPGARRSAHRGARSALTLTDAQRAEFIASIDRQIAEIDRRKNAKDA